MIIKIKNFLNRDKWKTYTTHSLSYKPTVAHWTKCENLSGCEKLILKTVIGEVYPYSLNARIYGPRKWFLQSRNEWKKIQEAREGVCFKHRVLIGYNFFKPPGTREVQHLCLACHIWENTPKAGC